MELSERNLDPVEKKTAPKNRSEVRSVLGVFNQFRHFFNRYDRLVIHMTRLLRKNVPFEWTNEHEKSFQYIRNQLLTGKLYLAAQDRDRPLIQETDGSDDGWGVILLQEVDGKRKALHMKRAPPYYKETAAWITGMERIRVYADYSPFPAVP